MNGTTAYLLQVRGWWPVILAIAVVAGLAGFLAAYSLRQPEYRATTTVSLGGASALSNLEEVRVAQEQAPTFAELARNPVVLDPVIEQLSLRTNSRDLAGDVHTKIIPDTALVKINVTASNKSQAARIATAVADQLTVVGNALQPQVVQGQQLQTEINDLSAKIAEGQARLDLRINQYVSPELGIADPPGRVDQDAEDFRQISALQIQLSSWRDAYQAKRQEIQDLPQILPLAVIQPTVQAGSSGGFTNSVLSGFMAAAAGLLLALGGLLVFTQSPDEGAPESAPRRSPRAPRQGTEEFGRGTG